MKQDAQSDSELLLGVDEPAGQTLHALGPDPHDGDGTDGNDGDGTDGTGSGDTDGTDGDADGTDGDTDGADGADADGTDS